MEILGIDVGGSGIKGALVDISSGELAGKRIRFETPQPALPEAMIKTIRKIVRHFDYQGRLGVGFPAAIVAGRTMTAANIHDRWIGYPARDAIAEATNCPVTLLNDADAAGLAEMRFGAGRDRAGVGFVLTLGTGIGSALFINGRLVPNLELGHLYLKQRKKDAEHYAAERARSRDGLSWSEWAGRLDEYLRHLNALCWPDFIILGGGVSKKHEKFMPYLTAPVEIIPARLRNQAGIVGAAMAAVEDNA